MENKNCVIYYTIQGITHDGYCSDGDAETDKGVYNTYQTRMCKINYKFNHPLPFVKFNKLIHFSCISKDTTCRCCDNYKQTFEIDKIICPVLIPYEKMFDLLISIPLIKKLGNDMIKLILSYNKEHIYFRNISRQRNIKFRYSKYESDKELENDLGECESRDFIKKNLLKFLNIDKNIKQCEKCKHFGHTKYYCRLKNN